MTGLCVDVCVDNHVVVAPVEAVYFAAGGSEGLALPVERTVVATQREGFLASDGLVVDYPLAVGIGVEFGLRLLVFLSFVEGPHSQEDLDILVSGLI